MALFKPAFGLKALMAAAAVLCAAVGGQAALVINEVCFDNSLLADETGSTQSDWIELYNTGPGSLNIRNYAVGDANPFESAKGVLLPDYTIPAGGYLVLFVSTDLPEYTFWTNAPDLQAVPPNATWRYYTGADGPASTWYDTNFNDVAWTSGISPLGYNETRLNLDVATPLSYGADRLNRYPAAYFRKGFNIINRAAVTNLVLRARVNDGAVVYLNGNVVLRQNMPEGTISHNTPALMGVSPNLWTTNTIPVTWLQQGTNVLAVEVHQVSVSSVDLIMDLTLTAQLNEPVPIVHGQFGLAAEGENVHLFNSTLTRIHRFLEPGFAIGQDRSYGLEPDGATASAKVYQKPTPGRSNSTYPQKYSEALITQKPAFSIPPGVYATPQNVVLQTPTAGYRIFYTFDGTSPSESTAYVVSGASVTVNSASAVTSGLAWQRTSPVELAYVGAVPQAAWQPPLGSITKAVVLRAIAVSADNKLCSPETRGTYFIGSQFTNRPLPLVSIITDTNNLFGFTSGLYVPGKWYGDSPVGYGANKWGKPWANYHQEGEGLEWERPVHLELFETGGNTASVSQLLGLTMHGGGTRSLPQKALYLMARVGEYRADRVNYPLFPDLAATSYKRFLLRSSGNDWYGPDYAGIATMLKDAAFHRMVQGLDTSVMAYRPTVAYINGEYWGIHNLRESFDKHYLATRYGLDPDNCDLLMHEEDPSNNENVDIERISGDSEADEDYKLLLGWIKTNPPGNAANYAQLQTSIDVTNYADYIITEMFFANTDWPVNNCDFWRAHTNQVAQCGKWGDTRWRWMLYDLDVAGAQGPYFNMFGYLTGSIMTETNEPAFLINQLWRNPDFNRHFVGRTINLLNTTFRPERLAGIVSAAAHAIEPEIETHFRRWGRPYTQAQWHQALTSALIQYTAVRHSVSWAHLASFFRLGVAGVLNVRNHDPGGTGGALRVNGMLLDSSTEGVTNRAAWSGTFFRSLPVPVVAVPDPGYVFDGWAGTAITNPTLNTTVGDLPLTLTARFRPVSAPPYVPTGFEQWQLANYPESEVLRGIATASDAPSGYTGLSNFQLYAFGMGRNDGLTDAQRLARLSLSISHHDNAFWLGYTRLNSSFTDVAYELQTTPTLSSPIVWRAVVPGIDVDTVSRTNVTDARTWFYEVRLPAGSAAADVRTFKLKAAAQAGG
jgi:uncharacterized repeat protein (TIGR02543 family)